MTKKICVSLVSHGHGLMVQELVAKLLKLDLISELIVTLNIPEDFPNVADERFKLVRNKVSKGFGRNHNDAFAMCDSDYFCVLNPDITLIDNPFPGLLCSFNEKSVGLVAPIVLSSNGAVEDSMRKFLTPWSLAKRLIAHDSDVYNLQQNGGDFQPDWVAGMFMLFKSEAYANVGGFDSRYHMYCEDADICTRLWKSGRSIVGRTSVGVIHNAQRASHKNFKHLCWHIHSLVRYFFCHSLSLPRKFE